MPDEKNILLYKKPNMASAPPGAGGGQMEKTTLKKLDNEYLNNENFRRTADNLTNGIYEVPELSDADRRIHLCQAWKFYLEDCNAY